MVTYTCEKVYFAFPTIADMKPGLNTDIIFNKDDCSTVRFPIITYNKNIEITCEEIEDGLSDSDIKTKVHISCLDLIFNLCQTLYDNDFNLVIGQLLDFKVYIDPYTYTYFINIYYRARIIPNTKKCLGNKDNFDRILDKLKKINLDINRLSKENRPNV